MFYKKFPEPYLADNADFVNSYSNLIIKFQNETHKLIIKHLTSDIKSIDEAIYDFKNTMCSIYKDVNGIVEAADYEVNNNISDKKEILRRNAKLQIVLKYDGPTKYSVKDFSDNYSKHNNLKTNRQFNNNNNNNSNKNKPSRTSKQNYNNQPSNNFNNNNRNHNKDNVQSKDNYRMRSKSIGNPTQNNSQSQHHTRTTRRNQSNANVRNQSRNNNVGRPGNNPRSRRNNSHRNSVSIY